MDKRKYFIAVVLRGQALERAEAIKSALHEQFGLRGALRSPSHITLHRPFEWPEKKEGQLSQKLGSFLFGPGFEVELEGFGNFDQRVLFIQPRPDEQLARL